MEHFWSKNALFCTKFHSKTLKFDNKISAILNFTPLPLTDPSTIRWAQPTGLVYAPQRPPKITKRNKGGGTRNPNRRSTLNFPLSYIKFSPEFVTGFHIFTFYS